MKIKTATTVNGVNPVYFGDYSPRFYWFKNLGDSTLYVSAKPNMIAGGDDVSELPPKSSTAIETTDGVVYILGAGKVEIHNTDSKFCPFRNIGASSGSGGSNEYVYGIVKNYNDFGNTEWTETRQRDINSFTISDYTAIECCFKISAIEGGEQGRVFETMNISNNLKYCMNITVSAEIGGALDISFNGSTWTRIPECRIDMGTLYTVTAVMHDSVTDIYVNGIFVATLPERVANNTIIYKIMMKASWSTNNRRTQGRVFSIRMYNKALSESEINYNRQIDVNRYGETN